MAAAAPERPDLETYSQTAELLEERLRDVVRETSPTHDARAINAAIDALYHHWQETIDLAEEGAREEPKRVLDEHRERIRENQRQLLENYEAYLKSQEQEFERDNAAADSYDGAVSALESAGHAIGAELPGTLLVEAEPTAEKAIADREHDAVMASARDFGASREVLGAVGAEAVRGLFEQAATSFTAAGVARAADARAQAEHARKRAEGFAPGAMAAMTKKAAKTLAEMEKQDRGIGAATFAVSTANEQLEAMRRIQVTIAATEDEEQRRRLVAGFNASADAFVKAKEGHGEELRAAQDFKASAGRQAYVTARGGSTGKMKAAFNQDGSLAKLGLDAGRGNPLDQFLRGGFGKSVLGTALEASGLGGVVALTRFALCLVAATGAMLMSAVAAVKGDTQLVRRRTMLAQALAGFGEANETLRFAEAIEDAGFKAEINAKGQVSYYKIGADGKRQGLDANDVQKITDRYNSGSWSLRALMHGDNQRTLHLPSNMPKPQDGAVRVGRPEADAAAASPESSAPRSPMSFESKATLATDLRRGAATLKYVKPTSRGQEPMLQVHRDGAVVAEMPARQVLTAHQGGDGTFAPVHEGWERDHYGPMPAEAGERLGWTVDADGSLQCYQFGETATTDSIPKDFDFGTHVADKLDGARVMQVGESLGARVPDAALLRAEAADRVAGRVDDPDAAVDPARA